jgi:peptidoglycan/xylan/chitin deacetylase (PgdA/CDA1 family)
MAVTSPAKTMRTTKQTGAGLVFLLLLLAAAGIGAGATVDGRSAARAAKAERLSRFPSFHGAVPVLLYHRVGHGHGDYSVSPTVFEAHLRRLHELGFKAITLDRYVAFMRGEKVVLPLRPILITFDDGYVSSWKNADRVLARYGWSAAMYMPTGVVGRYGRLTWQQLRQMEASGRWQIDEHAGDGHVLVTVDTAGRHGPFYANELWVDGRKESFAHYKRRVSRDIEQGGALLARHLPGSSHDTFAVPYGNYGQRGSNDSRIEPWLSGYLQVQFAVSFVQHDHSFTSPGQGIANRIAVGSRCNAQTLEMRLLQGLEELKRTAARRRSSRITSRAR